MIHHNAQAAMGGAYPDYYNAMHTKQDMTTQAPYIGDAADTYRAYHLFGGVPVAPLGGLERIGCHVGRHRKHCKDTAAKFEAIHERARTANKADRDVDITRDSKAFREQVRGDFGVNSELPPLVPLVRAPVGSSSSKAPPVLPISSKAPPVLPLGDDLPPLVPLVRGPVSSSSSSKAPPVVPIGTKAPAVLPIDCHMSDSDSDREIEGDISRAQMLLGSMLDSDDDDFVPVRASVALRGIPPCPPTIALIEAEEDDNPFGMPTLKPALAAKRQ
jgi:hypothetical protein